MEDVFDSDEISAMLLLRRDLVAQGLSDNQISRLRRGGVYERVRYGAYFPGGIWDQMSDEAKHRVRARAVLRTAADDSILSHLSSVIERGVPVWGFDLSVVHTTRMLGKSGRNHRDWTQHRGRLNDDQVELIEGIRVTRAARSAVELTTIGTLEASVVAIDGLLHAGCFTRQQLADEVEACRHWPSSLTADMVLRLVDGRHESVGERRFDFLCFKQGLPRPEPQVDVHDASGAFVARVDFAWPEYEVFLEFDGKQKYFDFRREGESLEQFLVREKQRQERVSLETGWFCIRITWADLAQPARLARRIRAILKARGLAAA
ncbi:MAG: hypothetical protein V9G04_13645 [Nocardioides sp.]|jgi:hypothetical protein